MDARPPAARRRRFLVCLFPLMLAAAVLPAAAGAGAGTSGGPAAIVTGRDAGWPDARGWTTAGELATTPAPWGEFGVQYTPYSDWWKGVRVAVGDVTGDGRPEIVTAPGRSTLGEIRVFDGRSYARLGAFQPFRGGAWWSGMHLATGDTDGDGAAEVVAGLDADCCTSVNVLDGAAGEPVLGFFPFGDRSEQGARVATADVNGDGRTELLVVGTYSHSVDFFAATGGAAFRTITALGDDAYGEVAVAAGDLLGDAVPELVVISASSNGPVVKIVDVRSGATLQSLYPFSPDFSSPDVAVADVDGDGHNDLVVMAHSPSGTQVKSIDGADGSQLASFFVLDPSLVETPTVAAGDLDGDGKAEIVLGDGPSTVPEPPSNAPDQRVVVLRADGTLVGGFSAYPGVFQGGSRVGLGDVNHDGKREIVTAPGPGTEPEIAVYSQFWNDTLDQGDRLAHFLAYEPDFRGGVDVAVADVLGTGIAQIVTAPGPGRPATVRVFDVNGAQLASFGAFDDSYRGGVSVGAGDLDADGEAEIVVGTLSGPARVQAFTSAGVRYGGLLVPFGGDRSLDVAVADVRGSGRGLVVVADAGNPDPQLALFDAGTGDGVAAVQPTRTASNGIRVGAGDLTGDGRDEILVSPRWPGDGAVRVLDGRRLTKLFAFWPDGGGTAGFDVAGPARIGLPIRADARTIELVAKKRARFVVARFTDAARTRPGPLIAGIRWGDGTRGHGLVLRRSSTVFDVRSTKRYARHGRYTATITFTDGGGRTSIARSTILVRRR